MLFRCLNDQIVPGKVNNFLFLPTSFISASRTMQQASQDFLPLGHGFKVRLKVCGTVQHQKIQVANMRWETEALKEECFSLKDDQNQQYEGRGPTFLVRSCNLVTSLGLTFSNLGEGQVTGHWTRHHLQ